MADEGFALADLTQAPWVASHPFLCAAVLLLLLFLPLLRQLLLLLVLLQPATPCQRPRPLTVRVMAAACRRASWS